MNLPARWAVVFGIGTLVSFGLGGTMQLTLSLLILMAMFVVCSYVAASIRKNVAQPAAPVSEPEEFTFQSLGSSDFDRSYTYHVTPTRHTYRTLHVYDGPPAYNYVHVYAIRGDQVFSRLTDQSHGFHGYENQQVIDGYVLEDEIRRGETPERKGDIFNFNTSDSNTEEIARLKQSARGQLIHGPLRYFILSLHRGQFSPAREKARLEKGMAAVQQAVTQISEGYKRDQAVDLFFRLQTEPFWRPEDAQDTGDRVKAGIKKLRDLNTNSFGSAIDARDLYDYDGSLEFLDSLLQGRVTKTE